MESTMTTCWDVDDVDASQQQEATFEQMMNFVAEDDHLLVSTPMLLSRGVSDALASFAGTDMDQDESDLDAVFEALDNGEEVVLQDDAEPDSPHTLSYSSSDDTTDAQSVQNSSSSSSECGEDSNSAKKTQKKKSKRASAGLSAQEKREMRKLRNRELAAESRKRKNDEMDRLRQENTALKAKIADLEKKLSQTKGMPAATVAVAPPTKRTRVGTTIGTSVAVASLTAFVLTAPSESHGVSSTASVLITALDSCDGGRLLFSSSSTLGQLFFTIVFATVVVCLAVNLLFRAMEPTSVLPSFFKVASSSSSTSLRLPKRMSSLTTISNSV
jgi:hypothetical protein